MNINLEKVDDGLGDTATMRIALCIEYDGSAYKGWQAQKSPNVPTVQETVEAALSQVADHSIKLICAGRTDTGVHASAQIVHFDTISIRPDKAWVKGANSLLPKNVSVRWAQQVNDDFHARFSAFSRHYRYVIYNKPVRPALLHGLVTHYYYPLNVDLMNDGAQHLVGKHDFTSYRGIACQANSPTRVIERLSITRFNDFIVINIKANAFLLHMVRNIAGVLFEIGEGRQKPQWVKEILELKDRSRASATASPSGLYLVHVGYPESFGLPIEEPGPAWLQGIGANTLF